MSPRPGYDPASLIGGLLIIALGESVLAIGRSAQEHITEPTTSRSPGWSG